MFFRRWKADFLIVFLSLKVQIYIQGDHVGVVVKSLVALILCFLVFFLQRTWSSMAWCGFTSRTGWPATSPPSASGSPARRRHRTSSRLWPRSSDRTWGCCRRRGTPCTRSTSVVVSPVGFGSSKRTAGLLFELMCSCFRRASAGSGWEASCCSAELEQRRQRGTLRPEEWERYPAQGTLPPEGELVRLQLLWALVYHPSMNLPTCMNFG